MKYNLLTGVMKKELDYFKIENYYGGNQEWFSDRMMNIGGCAAVTACDMCIYLDLYKDIGGLYPFDKNHITKADYIRFSQVMKPYLKPRFGGIDKLDIYLEGFGRYLKEHTGGKLSKNTLEAFSGNEGFGKAKQVVKDSIDAGFPIPYLLLRHKSPPDKDYVWHWFLLTGYEIFEESFMVKTVTYGTWRWFDFYNLWNTGYRKKGGMIIYGQRS